MSESYEIKNFRGIYKVKDDFGNAIVYNEGDVVSYQGKQYLATRQTERFAPPHGVRGGWKELDSNRSMNFTNSETQPELAVEGDHWYDSSSGKLYIVIKDIDTEQWVEV